LKLLQAEGRALRTHEYYDKLLRHLLNFSRDQCWPPHVNQLEPRYFRQFLYWVNSRSYEYYTGNNSRRFVKPKPSIAWPYYRAMGRLFNWGIEEGLLQKNPAKDIHFKAPPPPPIQPYNLDELKMFLAVCELDIKARASFIGMRNKGMILLFLDSGLRLSELAQLRLSDLDLDQKLVRVIGKGNKISICPFSAKTAKAIWLYLLERKKREKM
jgi:site-specific recombinase XerC